MPGGTRTFKARPPQLLTYANPFFDALNVIISSLHPQYPCEPRYEELEQEFARRLQECQQTQSGE